MIKIIGTSHISPESLREIKNTIKELKPACVAVELDPPRYEALKRDESISIQAIKYIGFKNYLIAKFLSIIQKHLGKKTGVMPGKEMLVAVEAAREVGAQLALIDQDIRKTLDGLRKMKFREKFRIFMSIFKFRKASFDLNEVPSEKMVEEMMDYLKEISPTLYRVLIDERDSNMAVALNNLEKKYEKVVGVVGIGHKKGIQEKLKQIRKLDKHKLVKWGPMNPRGLYPNLWYGS